MAYSPQAVGEGAKRGNPAEFVTAIGVLNKGGATAVVGTPTVTVTELDASGYVTHAWGATLPTDGDSGYAVGCVFRNTTGSQAAEYINEGTTSSAKFRAFTSTEQLVDFQNQVAAASYAVNHTIYLNDNVSGTFAVAGASVVFGTASTSGTLQVEVATGTQAITAGTNQLTGTMSLSGTANTVVNGTVIASPTTITAGARVNLIFGGTVTNLANCSVVVALKRLS